MKIFAKICLVVSLLTAASVVSAQSVYEFYLKNGLRLIVKVDKRAPVAVFQVWYKVGSSYEPNGITGIAHLTEHMMFDGTPKYPENILTGLLTVNGAAFNAFTDRDYTAYYEEMSVDRLPLAFQLESDRMINLSLTQQQFAKEINVVREERRLRTDDQPSQIALERFLAAAYISSPYHHPVVGWMDNLNHLTVADVRQWYNDWYAPNNATIVIVGDVDPAKILRLTYKYFGNLTKRTLPNVPNTDELLSLGKRSVIVKIPARVPVLFMGYNVPSLKTANNVTDVYALDVLAGILAGDESSRFARELVRGDQVANSADVNYDPFSRLDNLFILSGIPAKKDDIKGLHAAFEKQIIAVQNDLVTTDELQRVKAQVIANKIYSRDSIVNQASEIGAIVSVGLPLNTINTYTDKINEVTTEQIREVARKYLTENNLTETILQPLPMTIETPRQINDATMVGNGIH